MPSRFIASSLSLVVYSAIAIVMAAAPQSPTPRISPSPTPTQSPKPSPTPSPSPKTSPMPSPKPGAQSTPHATTAGAGADQAFVRTAVQGGHGEVELAKLAQDHAKDARVKAYAAMLERDHSKANKELSDLADKKTIQLSASESAASKATADRLQKLQGAAFDRAYIAEMVRDHQKDVAEFEKATRTLSDADLKAFVQHTLPTLKEHLSKAQQLQKDVK